MELFGLRDKDGKEYKLQVEQYRHGYTLSCFAAVFDLKPTKKYDSEYKIGQWVKYRPSNGSDVWFGIGFIVINHLPPNVLRLRDVRTKEYYFEREDAMCPMSQSEIDKYLTSFE